MKRTAAVCLALLIAGGILAASGMAAGGQLYGIVDGKLRPVAGNMDNTISSGGLQLDSQKAHDAVDIDKGFDSLDYDEIFQKDEEPDTDTQEQQDDIPVQRLEFYLSGGEFIIEKGEQLQVSPAAMPSTDRKRNGCWALSLSTGSGTQTTITLPDDTVYEYACIVLDGGKAVLQHSFRFQTLELYASGTGTLSAEEALDVTNGNFSISDGSMSVKLAARVEDYNYSARTDKGTILLNDLSLSESLEQLKGHSGAERQLSLSAAGGELKLLIGS